LENGKKESIKAEDAESAEFAEKRGTGLKIRHYKEFTLEV